MTTTPTGPTHFQRTQRLIDDAAHWMNADTGWMAHMPEGERISRRMADLVEAQVHATNANTAALVMIGGLIANATGQRDADLEAWADVIPDE